MSLIGEPTPTKLSIPNNRRLEEKITIFENDNFALRRSAAVLLKHKFTGLTPSLSPQLLEEYSGQYLHQLQEFDDLIHLDASGLWTYDFANHPEGKGLLSETIFYSTISALEKEGVPVSIKPANAKQDHEGVDFFVTANGITYHIDVSASGSEGILYKAGNLSRAFAILPVQAGTLVRRLPHELSKLIHSFLGIQTKKKGYPNEIDKLKIIKELASFHIGDNSLLPFLKEEYQIPEINLEKTRIFWSELSKLNEI